MSEDLGLVLVVDDELAIRRMLRTTLGAAGYKVAEAADGREGLLKVGTLRPDLILLDLGLPDMDGFQVLAQVREYNPVPVIVLTVQDLEEDKVKALDLGADDYLTKPFGMAELMARMRVAMRHSKPGDQEPVLSFGPLQVDLEKRLVTVGEKPVKLTATEYALLKMLVQNEGKVLTHRVMLRQVWGATYAEETHYLRVYVGQLRKKLEGAGCPAFIQTEAGVGYRFVPSE